MQLPTEARCGSSGNFATRAAAFVVDANAFELVSASGATDRLAGDEVVAPPLLWPELRSALDVARWRGLLMETTPP